MDFVVKPNHGAPEVLYDGPVSICCLIWWAMKALAEQKNSHINISQGTLTDYKIIPGKQSSQIIPTCFYKQVARVKTFYKTFYFRVKWLSYYWSPRF